MSEVYLYGMISASRVYILDESFTFPESNQYAEIKKSIPSVGGEAANSAIMLSKLGIQTRLDGNWLNQNHSDVIIHILKPFGIDISRLSIKENFGTEEMVITDKNSRTVFGNYAGFHSGMKQWNNPVEKDIQDALIVSLDPYFREESQNAAKMCVSLKKPYVTIDCRYDDYIAQNADAVIISHELRDQAYRGGNMMEIFEKYQANCKGLIVFTFGGDELWFARKGRKMKKYQPYQIKPLDTAGAGDSFRSGIIYGLLKSWDDETVIDFASAVSACVCLTTPHTLNAPGLDGVLRFMEENKRK